MALVAVQISSGAVLHLPWSTLGKYNSSCSLGELYESIKKRIEQPRPLCLIIIISTANHLMKS